MELVETKAAEDGFTAFVFEIDAGGSGPGSADVPVGISGRCRRGRRRSQVEQLVATYFYRLFLLDLHLLD